MTQNKKICTFNVNSLKARKDLVFQWLDHRNNDIDILCIQELKGTDDLFPKEDFENLGFHCAVFGQKTYNGVAICSKQPFEKVEKGFGDTGWDEQKRLISAKIGGLTIINAYAPHGGLRGEDKFAYKQDWYKNLIKHLNGNFSPEDPLILVGDLNVARADIDVYSPEVLEDTIGVMPEEREIFEKFLAWGLTDVFRNLHPDKKQFTWWGYMGGAIWKDEGMRIDYVLCTESLLKKFKSCEVDLWPRKRRSPTPSDHAPLIATFNL
jgi:exodeoxyribonuclease-3